MLPASTPYFLPAQCRAARLLAAKNWDQHALGPPVGWPDALKTTLATMLQSVHPMALWWGHKLYQFKNDAALAALSDSEAARILAAEAQPCQKLEALQRAMCGPEPELGGDKNVVPLLGDVYAARPEAPGQDWSPVYNQEGDVVAGLTVENLETAARRLQGDVALVLERMTDSFFLLDKNFIILSVNDRHVALTKIPRQAQLGRSFLDLFLPDLKDARSKNFYDMYRQVMRDGRAIAFQEYYEPLKIWTELNVYATSEGGIAVFFRDVTESKKIAASLSAEKHKFEAIFNGSPSAMALLRGDDLVMEHCNARYSQLIGERAIIGKKIEDVLVELRATPYFAILRQVLATGRTYVAKEQAMTLITRKGGSPQPCYLDFTYTRILDGAAKPYGVYIHAKNVTERVRSRQSLVAALKARDELLSICGHELKTPVASMKLSTQTFKRGLLRKDPRTSSPQRIAHMVEQSDRQLDRLTRLIEEMLDFSRMSSGQLKLTPTLARLDDLVADTLDRLGPQLEAAGMQASLRMQGETIGRWDLFRLEQLVTNLLTNALKYGEKKPIDVRVQGGPDEVTIAVRDAGPGIQRADQQRIFMPYERAVSATSIGGLGLGLYISRQIAEAHGGSLHVDSTPGQGATFVVQLPKNFGPSAPVKEQT